jgi:dTDP-4-amino-4,6-dideoxygalactose transaminase
VLRPRLPGAERLEPYLKRIDETRVYTNWGPLVMDFEARLCDHLQLPAGGVTSAGSGTDALVGAILGTAGRAGEERPLALLPAFTFIATAAAVEQCGYRPYLADVDAESWMLEPERLLDHPELDHVGLVVAVAPFGRPVRQDGWRAFRERTGIPVVIDGAASFDRVSETPDGYLGEIPVAISFHATKCFATAEGGCVASTDTELVLRAAQSLNFGFHLTRESAAPSINGKLSEYHSAIGLAELDGWDAKRAEILGVIESYRSLLGAAGLEGRLVASPQIGCSYVLFDCGEAPADRIEASLDDAAIGHRRWYGRGLHREPYYTDADHTPLEVTDSLAQRLIGVPLAPDLVEPDVRRVVDALVAAAEPG